MQQYVDAFLQDQYDMESMATTWSFGAGSSNRQAGVPAEAVEVTFETMSELKDMCGVSREWGGLHFSKAVPAAFDLCEGVGTKGYTDLMLGLLGAGTYPELMDDTKWKFGAECDAGCSSSTMSNMRRKLRFGHMEMKCSGCPAV